MSENAKHLSASTSMIVLAVLIMGVFPGSKEIGEICVKFFIGACVFLVVTLPLVWNHPAWPRHEPKDKPTWSVVLNLLARSSVAAALYLVGNYVLLGAFVMAGLAARYTIKKMDERAQ